LHVQETALPVAEQLAVAAHPPLLEAHAFVPVHVAPGPT
jgi:hypothetical protein